MKTKAKKTNWIGRIAVVLCLTIGVSSWLGCHHRGNLAKGTPGAANPAPNAGDSVLEYKTVEQPISADAAQNKKESARLMNEFRKEGWNVLSVRETAQPDGTTNSVWKLSREKR